MAAGGWSVAVVGRGTIVSPRTLLAWRKRMVAHRWTQPRPPGRPPIPEKLRDLIIRFGSENPRWGGKRVHGELHRLGHRVGISTVRPALRDAGLGPVVRSARQECTDNTLLLERGHAEKVLTDFATHFNNRRPHQGRNQLAPRDSPDVIPFPTYRTVHTP